MSSKEFSEEMEQMFVEILMNSEREQWASETSEELRRESAREIVQEGKKYLSNILHYILGKLEESLKFAINHKKFPSEEEIEPTAGMKDLEKYFQLFNDKLEQRYDTEKIECQLILKRLGMMQ